MGDNEPNCRQPHSTQAESLVTSEAKPCTEAVAPFTAIDQENLTLVDDNDLEFLDYILSGDDGGENGTDLRHVVGFRVS